MTLLQQMAKTCWVNNYRLLKQWHEIPFVNIDCAIHQICRNCKNPAMNSYYSTAAKSFPHNYKNSSRLCYYFGDQPNTSQRIAAVTQNCDNQYNNKVTNVMTRGGGCARKFLNYFLRAPVCYDTTNCITAHTDDPFEKNQRRSSESFTENYRNWQCPVGGRWVRKRDENEEDPTTENVFLELLREHLRQKRNTGSNRLPISTNKWIKRLCQLYGDVVTPPDFKAMWYNYGGFHMPYNLAALSNGKSKDRMTFSWQQKMGGIWPNHYQKTRLEMQGK
ncbi:hypothetical protein GQX74_007267 [Glossina fuscipes]|nr:hypothetical protein GQX74_007267 [Glossina fuscipes]